MFYVVPPSSALLSSLSQNTSGHNYSLPPFLNPSFPLSSQGSPVVLSPTAVTTGPA